MALVEPAQPSAVVVELGLDEMIADRVARLIAYQDEAYAERYSTFIGHVRAADPQAEQAQSITRAAVANLYKLMAYKDEYEVARLYSGDAFRDALEAQFEGDYELRFNLAPPLFSKRDPHSGELIKREFGPWVATAFQWLARLRFLRGGALDVFGYTAERRRERADIEDYRELLLLALSNLSSGNYPTALALAELPRELRGYGHVKDRNRERLNQQRDVLLQELRGEVSAVKIVEAA
jgi:indolepyruvate ferredoxin oxidoreductase